MAESEGRFTAAEAKRATNAAADVFVIRCIARPLSNLVTPFFYRAGATANQVTYGRFVIAIAILAAYVAWPPLTPVVVAWAFLDYVADCVDGALARLRNQASYWGKFIDGLVDAVGIFMLPFIAGAASGDSLWAVVGATSSLMAIGGQFVRARYAFFREWMIKDSGPLDVADQEKLVLLSRIEGRSLAWRVNASFALLAVLLFLDNGLYVAASAIVVLPMDALALIAVLRQGHAIMRRHRVSSHDSMRKREA